MERELLLKVVTDFQEQLWPAQEPAAAALARQAAEAALGDGAPSGAANP